MACLSVCLVVLYVDLLDSSLVRSFVHWFVRSLFRSFVPSSGSWFAHLSGVFVGSCVSSWDRLFAC